MAKDFEGAAAYLNDYTPWKDMSDGARKEWQKRARALVDGAMQFGKFTQLELAALAGIGGTEENRTRRIRERLAWSEADSGGADGATRARATKRDNEARVRKMAKEDPEFVVQTAAKVSPDTVVRAARELSSSSSSRVSMPEMDPWLDAIQDMSLIERRTQDLAAHIDQARMHQHRQAELDEWVDREVAALHQLRTKQGRAELRLVGEEVTA